MVTQSRVYLQEKLLHMGYSAADIDFLQRGVLTRALDAIVKGWRI